MINLVANSAYSSIAPFFPDEAKEHGVPDWSIGFIFSCYSISMCLFAPTFNQMMNKIGRKNVLLIGCLCEAIAMFCFGFFVRIESATAYGVLSCVARFIEGFGNGCLNSAINSVIQFNYPDNASNLIGLVQTFTGLGMLMGPILGSALYAAGGFQLPFFFCGGLLFLLTFLIGCILKSDRGNDKANTADEEEAIKATHSVSSLPAVDTSFFGVLKKFPVLASALCMSISLMCLTFKEPLLQLRLLDAGISDWMIGIIFSFDTITYTLTSVVLNFIPENQKSYQKLVASGTVFFVLAMLITGPCPGLPDEVWLICIGILIGGIGGALINNNVVPSLYAFVMDGVDKHDTTSRNKLTNTISAINTGFFGLGSIIGPTLASTLTGLLSFRLAFTYVSLIVLAISIVQWTAVCVSKNVQDSGR